MDCSNMNMYVTPLDSREVYQFNISQDVWKRLPDCPYQDSGLSIKKNCLLSVGGSGYGCEIFYLEGEGWRNRLPNMKTGRSRPAVVTLPHHLIVIGGLGQSNRPIASVEVLDDQTNTWTELQDLPRPLGYPSATVCGEQLYVLPGGWADRGEGYSCSISELSTSSGSPPALTWTPIPLPPVYWSTIATLSGHPVTIGGVDRETRTYTSTVYSLSHGQWVECGHLCEARYHHLVASLTTCTSHMLVVVGGHSFTGYSATVELCSVV